jgi:hypothetical protein
VDLLLCSHLVVVLKALYGHSSVVAHITVDTVRRTLYEGYTCQGDPRLRAQEPMMPADPMTGGDSLKVGLPSRSDSRLSSGRPSPVGSIGLGLNAWNRPCGGQKLKDGLRKLCNEVAQRVNSAVYLASLLKVMIDFRFTARVPASEEGKALIAAFQRTIRSTPNTLATVSVAAVVGPLDEVLKAEVSPYLLLCWGGVLCLGLLIGDGDVIRMGTSPWRWCWRICCLSAWGPRC